MSQAKGEELDAVARESEIEMKERRQKSKRGAERVHQKRSSDVQRSKERRRGAAEHAMPFPHFRWIDRGTKIVKLRLHTKNKSSRWKAPPQDRHDAAGDDQDPQPGAQTLRHAVVIGRRASLAVGEVSKGVGISEMCVLVVLPDHRGRVVRIEVPRRDVPDIRQVVRPRQQHDGEEKHQRHIARDDGDVRVDRLTVLPSKDRRRLPVVPQRPPVVSIAALVRPTDVAVLGLEGADQRHVEEHVDEEDANAAGQRFGPEQRARRATRTERVQRLRQRHRVRHGNEHQHVDAQVAHCRRNDGKDEDEKLCHAEELPVQDDELEAREGGRQRAPTLPQQIDNAPDRLRPAGERAHNGGFCFAERHASVGGAKCSAVIPTISAHRHHQAHVDVALDDPLLGDRGRPSEDPKPREHLHQRLFVVLLHVSKGVPRQGKLQIRPDAVHCSGCRELRLIVCGARRSTRKNFERSAIHGAKLRHGRLGKAFEKLFGVAR
eukprot:scaffold48_cov311-Pinguiococcus_pyrenoidosus.AAC.196